MITERKKGKEKKKREREKKGVMFRLVTNFIQKYYKLMCINFF